MLAKELMSYTADALTKATKAGELIEIEVVRLQTNGTDVAII
jgi:hypothetical protein